MKESGFVQRNQQTFMLVTFGILILLRLALSSRLPAYILADMPHDDAWVVKRAGYILMEDWFGPYDQFTLIKGPFSPLLMAFCAFFGVSFSGINTALYCFGCIIFVFSIRPIIRNYWLLLCCFAVLLFNPIPYALETGQRIYRNGIGQWQIIIIFACLIGLFLRRNGKVNSLWKWAILGGFVLGTFVLTREDRMWIFPLVLVATCCMISAHLIERHGENRKIFIFLLPLVIAISMNGAAAGAHYLRYGVFILNDRSGGNYAKVAEDLYSIAPDNADEILYSSSAYKGFYLNIYRSTVEMAFTVSPTLNSIAPSVREAINQWASWDDPQKIGQLPTDHLLFALRDGVKLAGYYRSMPETEAFYLKVHQELQAGFAAGTLLKRGVTISALIQPLQKGDFENTLHMMPKAILDIAQFSGVSSELIPEKGSKFMINVFKLIAGGESYSTVGSLVGNGWAFAKDNYIRLTVGLYDKDGKLISNLPFYSGEDVYQFMRSNGFEYENAKSSRFSFDIDSYNLTSGARLRFIDANGNAFREYPADGSVMFAEDASFRFNIDNLKTTSPERVYSHFVNRANSVISLYKKITPILGILGIIAYLFSTILLILEIRTSKSLETLPVWLCLTSLASTFLLFMLIMCFVTVTSFNALVYIYTAPAFILLLMFSSVAVSWMLDMLMNLRYRLSQ